MKRNDKCLALVLCAVIVIGLSLTVIGRRGSGAIGTATPQRSQSSGSTANGSVSTSAVVAKHPQTARAYGKLPLCFEANRGQTDPRVKFLSRGHGYGLLFTSTEAIFSLDRAKNADVSNTASSSRRAAIRMKPILVEQRSVPPRRPALLRMSLVGASPAAHATGLDELPGKANYFLGNDPRKWHTNVPTYARVKYKGVYRGVDLIYYGNQQDLESDFVVAPGINPSVIQLRFRGAKSSKINSDGDLLLKISGGEIILRKPVAYQRRNNEISANDSGKQFVAARYVLKGQQEVAFAVESYDASRQLIIDPVLSYSTYLGGSSNDFGNAIAVDASGNAYVTGHTNSSDFPTAGPVQASYHPSGQNCVNTRFPTVFPCPDAFVTKLNAAGTAILYSTYLGGSAGDGATGIAVDSSGNAYVAGGTASTDFPTMNPVQASLAPGGNCGTNPITGTPNPCSDAFVAKLNPTGDALVFSTYLGGSGSDGANAIAVDSFGSAYVAGFTSSSDFPTTPGAYDTTCGTDGACNPNTSGINGSDAFVTKFDPSGSKLLYSTYLGGSSDDNASGIALDSSANAYVSGGTYSSDFPTTPGAFDTVGRSQGDAFVAKLDQTGAKLLYSTYLGGGGWDSSAGIAVDAFGNACVTGFTYSTDFPTQNPFQATSAGISNGGSAAFVTKLNPVGTALVYSTYLGGSVGDAATGIALDSSGEAYVTGGTFSNDFPISNPVQAASSSNGSADAFVAKLDPTGSKLVYSTYLGGNGSDGGNAIAVDASGNAFVTGSTALNFYTPISNFPVTLGSLMTTPGGGVCAGQSGSSLLSSCADAFVVKISPANAPGFVVLPEGLNFGFQAVSTSVAQTLSLLDAGSQGLTISSIAFSGMNAGDFSETTTCPVSSSTLSGGTNCTISVTFSPPTLGTKSATLVITDDAAGSPHSIPLTGVSATPATAVLSPTSLTFGSEPIGSSSSPQAITLTNTGGVPLSISGISFVPDFSSSSTCASTVSGGTSCTINVVFAPQTSGPLNESLTLTDNAADSPQTVALSGTGQDFTLSASSTSATITAGQTGTFTLSVTPESGFNQATILSCSVSPVVSLGPACSVIPTSVTPNGSTAVTATVTVTTASRTLSSAAIIKRTIFPESRLWAALLCFPALACVFTGTQRRRAGLRRCASGGIIAVLLLALLSVSCGGGSSSSGAQSGTPAGTYTVTVTGTSGSLTHTINLTLKVN